MKNKDLHLKFAKNLYKLAEKNNQTAKFFEEITYLKQLANESKFLETLDNLGLSEVSVIKEVLVKVLGQNYSDGIVNMLVLLTANHQLKLIPSIQSVFQKLYFEAEGISDLLICTSRELSVKEQETLVKELRDKKKKIHVEFVVNPDLIGGMQIYDNGKLTDFSLKNQLENLRRQLLGEHIV